LGGIVENERRPARRCHGPRSRPPRRSDAWADARLAAFGQNRPQRPEIADRVLVDAILHRLEHLEAFFLVLDQGIALTISPQADALLEVVEAVEMILPLSVDDLQHDVALDPLQHLPSDELFLLFVRAENLLPRQIAKLVGGSIVEPERRCLHGEDAARLAFEACEIPLLEVGATGGVRLNERIEDVFGKRHQVFAGTESLLLALFVLEPNAPVEN